MANQEMWDYIPTAAATPDYSATLTVAAQRTMLIEGSKSQVVHTGDDASDEVITLCATTTFYVSLQWECINESDAGTIFSFWHDSSKANGLARSFAWTNYAEATDQHTYIVKFAEPIPRTIMNPNLHAYTNVKLKIIGRNS